MAAVVNAGSDNNHLGLDAGLNGGTAKHHGFFDDGSQLNLGYYSGAMVHWRQRQRFADDCQRRILFVWNTDTTSTHSITIGNQNGFQMAALTVTDPGSELTYGQILGPVGCGRSWQRHADGS